MTDPADDPDIAAPPDDLQPPAMPRWVKVSMIVAGVLLLVFVLLTLAGVGGRHGPGRHLGAWALGHGTAPPAAQWQSSQ